MGPRQWGDYMTPRQWKDYMTPRRSGTHGSRHVGLHDALSVGLMAPGMWDYKTPRLVWLHDSRQWAA